MKKVKKTQPVPYQISESGSLGILALGAKGVTAWRKIRDQKKQEHAKK